MNNTAYNPVIKTKVEIKRNIKEEKFPTAMNVDEKSKVLQKIVYPVIEKTPDLNGLEVYIFETMPEPLANELIEKEIISKDSFSDKKGSGLLYNPKKNLSVIINQEDHLTIQGIKKGLTITEIYEEIVSIEESFRDSFEYAQDENHGYLTSSLTNVGTGVKVFVNIHIPGIIMSGKLDLLIKELSAKAIAVKVAYNLKNSVIGNALEISNKVTIAEVGEIFAKVSEATAYVIEKERHCRDKLMEKDQLILTDRIYRAFGILKNARLISYKEAMRYFSDIIFGIEMGIIEGMEVYKIRELGDEILASAIQRKSEKTMNFREIDFKRAEILRESLK